MASLTRLAACTATYAVGHAAVHGLATDSGIATPAISHSTTPAQHPPFEAKYGLEEEDVVLLALQPAKKNDHTIKNADGGALNTNPVEAGELQKGSYVVINGHACKVESLAVSKVGKHGHAKVHIVALDIFTNEKFENLVPASHVVDVPSVERTDFELDDVDKESGIVILSGDTGDLKEGLKLPDDEELLEEMINAIEDDKNAVVTVLSALGEEKIVAMKLK